MRGSGRARDGGGRLRSALLPALLIAAAPAAQALATFELTGVGGRPLHGPFKRWARAAHTPLPDGTVKLGLHGCPGRPDLVGCVVTRRPRTIYLRPDARGRRSIFLHELGHVFDLTVMGRADRSAFARLHGRSGRAWWRGRAPTAEWFAEAYSLCARFGHRRPAGVATTYAYRPNAWRQRASCRLIRKAAAEPRRHKGRRPPKPPPTLVEPPPPAPAPAPPPPSSPPPERECRLVIFCP